jgi:uncharacterized membrane protein HdeD (DUF308 family)
MDAQKERSTSVALAISGGALTFVSFVAGIVSTDLRALIFLSPLGAFVGVLGILRMWITPKPGRKFFSPGIWWGGFYGLIGLLIGVPMFIGAASGQDALGLLVPFGITALLLFSVPGFTVMAMGLARTSKVNKSLKGA